LINNKFGVDDECSSAIPNEYKNSHISSKNSYELLNNIELKTNFIYYYFFLFFNLCIIYTYFMFQFKARKVPTLWSSSLLGIAIISSQ